MEKELGTAGGVVGMSTLCALFAGLAFAIYPGWQQRQAAAKGKHARKLEQEKKNAQDVQRLNVVKALMARSHGLAKDGVVAFADPSQETLGVVMPALMRDTAATLLGRCLFSRCRAV